MKIQTYEEKFHKKFTVRELFSGYNEDTKTGAVTAFDGKLNLRPSYQRSFIYELDRQTAVIQTIMNGCPLNTMYWAQTGPDSFEMMDGQQRSISICKFVNDDFSVNIGKQTMHSFSNIGQEIRQKILDYPLMIYICEGTEEEKLEWFRKINIAGLKLTDQEMRNAIYTSPWVTDAKRYFSKPNCIAYASEGDLSNDHIYGDYLNVENGSRSEKETAVVRQKLLEIVLSWAVDATGDSKMTIEEYMCRHCSDENARELWRYYEDVMEWVKNTFPTYRPVMKQVPWGILYNRYHEDSLVDADSLANKLFGFADEITNTKGIYEAVLSGDIRHLNARKFDKKDINRKFYEQNGICPYCHGKFDIENLEGDHIVPWSKGGVTEYSNLQLLCKPCNIKKTSYDAGFKPWEDKEYEAFDLFKWDSFAGE